MKSSQVRRLSLIAAGLVVATVIVIGRLVVFQIIEGEEWAEKTLDTVPVVDRPGRGVIYDRHGAVLAVDKQDYQVGISPNLVTNPEELSLALAPILEESRLQLLTAMESSAPFELLSPRVSQEVAEAIRGADEDEVVQLDPMPRRFYPQGSLMCHVLGYVDLGGNAGGGVEGYYQNELAGEAASADVSISPLAEQPSVIAREGADLVLTIDRSVQFTVERHLKEALVEHGAVSGTIIVMDPRTGAILAMASEPCYEPNEWYEADDAVLLNPIVTQQYEPGSVMKLVTMAAALDSGTVTPTTTYNDTGELWVGGHRTVNWDRSAPGTVDMTTLLSRSLNVGAATLATWMGADKFYDYYSRFGFGKPTGIDIFAESTGLMPLPGDAYWNDSFLATNAYGQSLAVTPLQMISAVAAIANGGYLMQPYVVQEIHDATGVHVHEPRVSSQAIGREAANQLTAMAVTAVNQEVPEAQIPGYTVAGKTGTAQIAENGIYHPTDVIGSFIGWLPADAPEIVVFVKLDRPTSAPWGSMTAAPTFAKLTKELVVMLDIPPDEIRLQPDIVAARGAGE
jgi:cell division protein FtsI/penicillin-binding protein 2